MEIEKKQKHHDKVLKKLTALLAKEKMSIVAFESKDGSRNIMLRLVDLEDLDEFHKLVDEQIQEQINEQIKVIDSNEKGDKINDRKSKKSNN